MIGLCVHPRAGAADDHDHTFRSRRSRLRVYLQRECGLTQGNLSSHLSKLEEAGYLTITKTFKGKYPLTRCLITNGGAPSKP
jgi:DNA-binding transcriptional ArsR family regulator